MADLPRSGLVSMLASKFGELKSSKESLNEGSSIPAPSTPATKTAASSSKDPLEAAILIVVDQTELLKSDDLTELAKLLNEANQAASLDDLQKIGEKMTSLAKKISPNLGNYTSSLTEIIPIFQWKHLPSNEIKPGEFISGCQESAEFYLNRIKVEQKAKNEQSEWVASIETLVKEIKASTSTGAKTVSNDKPKIAQAAPKQKGSTEPTVTLTGNKWTVENGTNSSNPVTIKVESFSQAIFVDNCVGLTIVVEGKVNAISIIRCKKLKVQVGDVVSNIEALTSNGCDMFLQGTVPTIVLDNCEGVRMFLTEKSKAVQVLSSKCSELNLVASRELLGQANVEDPEETVEIALPFQFKSVLGENGHIVTEPVKHAGA